MSNDKLKEFEKSLSGIVSGSIKENKKEIIPAERLFSKPSNIVVNKYINDLFEILPCFTSMEIQLRKVEKDDEEKIIERGQILRGIIEEVQLREDKNINRGYAQIVLSSVDQNTLDVFYLYEIRDQRTLCPVSLWDNNGKESLYKDNMEVCIKEIEIRRDSVTLNEGMENETELWGPCSVRVVVHIVFENKKLFTV